MQDFIIAIASDHAGFELKQAVIASFKDRKFLDLGCFSNEATDYPDYAYNLCQAIQEKRANQGILICGTGIGMSIAANRFADIRAALCTDDVMAKLAREHNDANILVLGARIIDQATALTCIDIFFKTEYIAKDKHQRRIDKLGA